MKNKSLALISLIPVFHFIMNLKEISQKAKLSLKMKDITEINVKDRCSVLVLKVVRWIGPISRGVTLLY